MAKLLCGVSNQFGSEAHSKGSAQNALAANVAKSNSLELLLLDLNPLAIS